MASLVALRGLAVLGSLAMASAGQAATLTATFDGLSPNAGVASGYTEGGIQFTSPSGFGVATGYFGAVLHGWGGYSYAGNTLYVHNTGWVGMSAPGYTMNSVSFKYGFDWNGYMIEYRLMETRLEWQTFLGSVQTGAGAGAWNFGHGGGPVQISSTTPFDQLLVRSVANAYEGIYQGPNPPATPENPNRLYYLRGPLIGYGDANHIAFDNVSVSATAVSEGGSAFILFVGTLVIGYALRPRMKR